jgi:hypothetical protein
VVVSVGGRGLESVKEDGGESVGAFGSGLELGVLDCAEGSDEERHEVVDVEIGSDRAVVLSAGEQPLDGVAKVAVDLRCRGLEVEFGAGQGTLERQAVIALSEDLR